MLLLLVIIYFAFISLGLPDAVLGASWPMMHQDLAVGIEYAGAVALLVSVGTVLSSLLTVTLIKRFGVGVVVAASVALTAMALVGFSMSQGLIGLMLLSLPLGLGAGAVDSALNNFVATHYQSKHMNYLHSFWGVGATSGPLLMANYLLIQEGWRDGYQVLGGIQFALVVALFASLPLWKKALDATVDEDDASTSPLGNRAVLSIAGVKIQMLMFFCYCAIELGAGLWAASFLIVEKGALTDVAALWVAIYYGGITAGRFLCGAIADRFNEAGMIRVGALLILAGAGLLLLPIGGLLPNLGLLLIGLGCAPVFPNTLHLTPARFGKRASQAIISVSMATAYVGNTIVPPTMGIVLKSVSFAAFPYLLFFFALILWWTTERLNHYQQ
ncbi:MFS transporter [Maribrevibacterium harenarium]|uniref:MFS transporter n=1 Tax=Maribrevibacterium harenarium TaxID=2589817 RepID=A0A501WF51_9GAMM|nr:MFS transporter [Maribrevibacterium harenarium]TPE44156.1 MFS transporter [Maribrevibacterium harenarium]